MAELDEFLARTDILVCLLPLTPETRGILGRRAFRRPAARRLRWSTRDAAATWCSPTCLDALTEDSSRPPSSTFANPEPLPQGHPLLGPSAHLAHAAHRQRHPGRDGRGGTAAQPVPLRRGPAARRRGRPLAWATEAQAAAIARNSFDVSPGCRIKGEQMNTSDRRRQARSSGCANPLPPAEERAGHERRGRRCGRVVPSSRLVRVSGLEQAGYIAGYGARDPPSRSWATHCWCSPRSRYRTTSATTSSSSRPASGRSAKSWSAISFPAATTTSLKFITRGVNHYQEIIEGSAGSQHRHRKSTSATSSSRRRSSRTSTRSRS